MTPLQAREAVAAALAAVAPDADLGQISDDEDMRTAFELDSIDFQAFAARLAERTGEPIAEDEYIQLSTVSGCVKFLG
ncbi:acyl carrier protein [Kibdelosporangium aridum]|uniref:Acyl carrier protein n=1 Tax=Kibdelosporangium aridum TaxID=2030 RepID=A0A428ZAT5_KIBAR|nr:acyl carrier protein [Kibdelosporangium aridum]RSM85193.1 acyl carrier protein [Kibdelosporangium aridum]